jgi:integrase
MPDFPTKLQKALDLLNPEDRLIVELKLVTQMRTGNAKEERGVFGIRKNAGKSYLMMDSADTFRFHVLEKMHEEWDITFLPPHVREKLWTLYQTKQDGEYIFKKDTNFNKRWNAATIKAVGTPLNLHDSRKISVTWFYACGLPLEIATSLNVGWKDLNTPRDHYLQLRNLLRKSEKAAYVSKIPDWFKVGLDEYKED